MENSPQPCCVDRRADQRRRAFGQTHAPERTLCGFDQGLVEFEDRIVRVIQLKHGAQMFLDLRPALAVVLAWIAVFLPILLHPRNDQIVIDFRCLAPQHQVDLQRLVQCHRIGHP